MQEEKMPLSEAARWFLKDFQRLLDEFSEEQVVQCMAANRQGDLVTELKGAQRVCKLILASEDGRVRCRDHFKVISSLANAQKKPVCLDCYAGFVAICIPIILGETIGTLISCGRRLEKWEDEEKLRERFGKLADELGIFIKEDFLKAAMDEVVTTTNEEIRQRIQSLAKLVDILREHTHTPLKEVFG